MNTKYTIPILVLICGMAFNTSSQTITTTPTDGVTVKGRVLDDATGKPIADARIDIADFELTNGTTLKSYMFDAATGRLAGPTPPEHGHRYNIRTDAEGRYGLSDTTGHVIIGIHTTNLVAQSFIMDATKEASLVFIPDIRLQHGGWISGRVEPADTARGVYSFVTLMREGDSRDLPTDRPYRCNLDGTFRTEALSSGSYTLRGYWDYREGLTNNWHGEGSVSNITVVVGQDTTNIFIPVKKGLSTIGRGSSRGRSLD